MKKCKNVTLEMSLKPFKMIDDKYIKSICIQLFEQWKPLIKNFENISILMWTADGSELLDYTGNESDSFEWCKYMGSANPEAEPPSWDPQGESLSANGVLYIDNPPAMTYKILKKIIKTIKETGKEIFGKDIRVGETFDIGPEFARSDFKYRRHREICFDGSGNTKCFINGFGTLNADNYSYKTYPDGIPEGTLFVEFFAKQTQAFLTDMGFDYIWLSNGMGFCQEPWNSTGEIFDGEKYYVEKLDKVKSNIYNFWSQFRKWCPNYPIETRGTNFSVGIDYSTDAVPLWDIYMGNFNILPPPNSPWAALDGNFGLELMGYMSRMAEIPGESYLFRYYLHDPWWVNSPWYDRYESQPHDIYLPMAVARLNSKGKIQLPDHLNIFSVDNSYGNMPDQCAEEVIPHIKKAFKEAPDAPSPFVWVYPFREYTNSTDEKSLRTMFANDWFICAAINDGLPVSTVISTENFISSDKSVFSESVIVSPVPSEEKYEKAITEYIKSGGKALLYGSVDSASEEFLNFINIKVVACGKGGELKIDSENIPDKYLDDKYPERICYKPEISCGELNTEISDENKCDGAIKCNGKVLAVFNKNCVWYRAPVSASYVEGQMHLNPDKASEYVLSEQILRKTVSHLGYEIKFIKPCADVKSPVIMVNRNNNAFFFSVYTPSTTVVTKLKFPMGAPLLIGYETEIKNSFSKYNFPRAEHRECRVFVNQDEKSIVSCCEYPPCSDKMRRRIRITGLKGADVVFYPETYAIDDVEILINSNSGLTYTSDPVYSEKSDNYYIIKNVTGQLILSMPSYKKDVLDNDL